MMLVVAIAWEVSKMCSEAGRERGSGWVVWVWCVVGGMYTDVPTLDCGHAVVEEEGEDRRGGVEGWEEEGVLPVARCRGEGGVCGEEDSERGGMELQLVESRGEVEEDVVGLRHAEVVFFVVEEVV